MTEDMEELQDDGEDYYTFLNISRTVRAPLKLIWESITEMREGRPELLVNAGMTFVCLDDRIIHSRIWEYQPYAVYWETHVYIGGTMMFVFYLELRVQFDFGELWL